MTKIGQSFPITQSKSGPDPRITNKFTVRIRSKINKIRHSPGLVQSKSSPETSIGLDPDYSKFCWICTGPGLQITLKLKIWIGFPPEMITEPECRCGLRPEFAF